MFLTLSSGPRVKQYDHLDLKKKRIKPKSLEPCQMAALVFLHQIHNTVF